MDTSEALSALRLLASIGVLGYASVLDLRTRRVPNKFWVALSAFGLLMLVVQVVADEAPLEYLSVLIPIVAILSDVYLARSKAHERLEALAKYALAVIAILAIGIWWGSDEYAQKLVSVPVLMLLFVVLYMLDMIRGGADAKALIALAIVFPFYPSIGQLPLISNGDVADIILPFAFVVLVTAAIVVALTPLWFLLTNAATGHRRLPQALFGRVMTVQEAQKAQHIWLMERMEDRRHVFYTRPRRDEDLLKELRLLSEGGHTEVWVTPKIPFIVPMLIGLVFAATVGNLLALFLNA